MTLSRRSFVTGVAGGVTAGFAGALAAASPASAVPATIDNLGIPLRDVLLIGGAIGPGPNGKSVLWSAVSGEPANLAAIDPRTRRTVSHQRLEGCPGSYAVVVAPDGSVYVAPRSPVMPGRSPIRQGRSGRTTPYA